MPRVTGSRILGETMNKALELLPIIVEHPGISKDELAEKSGRSKATLYRHLKALSADGYLVIRDGDIAVRKGLDKPFSESMTMFSRADRVFIRVTGDTEIKVHKVAGLRGLEIELIRTTGDEKN